MDRPDATVLVLCYGNPGRLDDGLGAAFGEALERALPAGVTVDVDYQLTVEDAAAVAEHRYVVFVDAAVEGPEPFFFRRLEPKRAISFSSHSIEPENLLALARDLFGREAEGYALGIRGYEFHAFGERLSEGAGKNLGEALQFMLAVLERRSFREAAGEWENDSGVSGPRMMEN